MIRPEVLIGYIGRIITIIGIAMLSCIGWSIYYKESIAFSLTLASCITIASGLFLSNVFNNKENLNYKEGFAVVTLGWIIVSLYGTLPYLLTGTLPSFADALFETVSGFSTTGSSVISDIEALPKGVLFWRSITQWLGGMGIIALFVAIIAGMGARANQIFRAEVPGPISDKISPRIRENAKALWKSYIVLSIICVVLLYIFGMDIFDAFCHTFATMATGGFSTKNTSIAYYGSPFIQWTIIVFMFIAGCSFSLHYLAYKNQSLKLYFRDQEFKFYGGIILASSLIVFIALSINGTLTGCEEKIRSALFQIISITTTTGFASADYEGWPVMAKGMIFLAMFVGGCAGSTGGNIKPGRYLIILQRTIIELKQMVHPKAVLSLRYRGKVLSDSLIINVLQFFFLYMSFLMLGTIVLSFMGMDILSGLTATIACLGNIGPGFGMVGPTQNYAFISDGGKYFLSILMLIGRLEIYPVLVLFIPQFWKE